MSKRKSSSSTTSKPSKPAPRDRDVPFKAAHAIEYGLQVTQCDPQTLKVLGVRCNFCAFFGHELLDGQERYRKQTTNVKSWTSFRTEYYRDHHNGQHSIRWKEYQRLNQEEKQKYFTERVEVKDTIPHHFQQGDTRHTYRIEAAIVDIVLGISFSF